MGNRLLYQEETYQINAALFEVHKQLGCGFLERVYQEALAEEFRLRNIPFEKEKRIPILYKGTELQAYYVADFVCFDKIIVELKSVDGITDMHTAQLLNYLKATQMQLGILVNFNETYLKPKRIIATQHFH